MKQNDSLIIGDGASCLFLSLRSFEAARRAYFRAYAIRMGEYMAEKKMEQESAIWAAVEALIQNDIATHLRGWAWDGQSNTI